MPGFDRLFRTRALLAFLLLFLVLIPLGFASGCRTGQGAAPVRRQRRRRPAADGDPAVVRRLALGLRHEGADAEPAPPDGARRACGTPDSGLPVENLSESLHPRHRPLSRRTTASSANNMLRSRRCMPASALSGSRGGRRRPLVGRRADLGDRAAARSGQRDALLARLGSGDLRRASALLAASTIRRRRRRTTIASIRFSPGWICRRRSVRHSSPAISATPIAPGTTTGRSRPR